MLIDMDSHLAEGWFLDEVYKLDGAYEKFSPQRVGDGKYRESRFTNTFYPWDSKAVAAFQTAHPAEAVYDPNRRDPEVAARQRGGWDMDRRIADMRRESLDAQLLFPTDFIRPTWTTGGLGAALTRSYNNWVKRLVAGNEDKLWPVGLAPAGCPDEMASELRRCVNELGFRVMHLVPHAGARNLDEPEFFEYFAAAEELGVPLLCHPNIVGEYSSRFNNFFPMHIVGRPVGCLTALVSLVTGGVFEKFPNLKVAFFECSAEWIVYWMHRMDEDWEWVKDEPIHQHLTMLPSEYIKRNCYVSCEADEKLLSVTLQEFDETHVLMATDYPHFDSEFPNTVSSIRDRTDITERQKRLILEENAASLLRI